MALRDLRPPALLLLGALLPGTGAVAATAAPQAVADDTKEAGKDGVPVPKRSRFVRPEYPAAAIDQGLRGIVILELRIDMDGRVMSADVIRSIPGLDEAALRAVRQWEYEPTVLDGQPVRVRLTVPITFAIKLPEIANREEGIPTLRQGGLPPYPESETSGGRAVVEVTLAPEGHVVATAVLEGTAPWTDSVERAVRTWRFSTNASDAVLLSFRVEVVFAPRRADETPEARIELSNLRSEPLMAAEPVEPAREAASDSPAAEPASTDDAEKAEPGEPAPPQLANADPVQPPDPEPVPTSDIGAAEPEPVGETRPDETRPDEAEATKVADSVPAAEPGAPSTPAETAPGPGDAEPAAAASAAPLASDAPAQGVEPLPDDTTAGAPAAAGFTRGSTIEEPSDGGPPVEVLRSPVLAPPPAELAVPGYSSIEDVELGVGVPDLIQGRRPVVPPLARVQRVTGVVDIRFAVNAAGEASVQEVVGPELLQAAARASVSSWTFRRNSAERLFLTASFDYGDALVSARVALQE